MCSALQLGCMENPECRNRPDQRTETALFLRLESCANTIMPLVVQTHSTINSAVAYHIVAHIGRANTSVSANWELLKSSLLVVYLFISFTA